MLERLWGKGNTSALLVGIQAGTAPLDVSVVISQKIRKQPFSRPSNTSFGDIPKGCSVVPQGHVLNYVHSSFIHNSQNLETTSTKDWIKKMCYIYTIEYYTMILINDILKFASEWI